MKKQNSYPNFAISGWSGSGSTSLTLILATLFKLKLLPATKIFRAIDKSLGFGKSGKALRKEFEEYVQPLVGKTIDNYTDYKLLNDNNIILESDLAAFRIGNHPKVFSIFVKTNMETRRERVKAEGREKRETAIGRRDNILRSEYIKLWDTDIFDEELINRKYSLVIDNSNISFEDEVQIILDALSQDQIYKNVENWDMYRSKVAKLIIDIQKNGKEKTLAELINKKTVFTIDEMMREIAMLYPEEIADFPDKIQKMFLGQV